MSYTININNSALLLHMTMPIKSRSNRQRLSLRDARRTHNGKYMCKSTNKNNRNTVISNVTTNYCRK